MVLEKWLILLLQRWTVFTLLLNPYCELHGILAWENDVHIYRWMYCSWRWQYSKIVARGIFLHFYLKKNLCTFQRMVTKFVEMVTNDLYKKLVIQKANLFSTKKLIKKRNSFYFIPRYCTPLMLFFNNFTGRAVQFWKPNFISVVSTISAVSKLKYPCFRLS